jgi:hypothetical protein
MSSTTITYSVYAKTDGKKSLKNSSKFQQIQARKYALQESKNRKSVQLLKENSPRLRDDDPLGRPKSAAIGR